jgi:hypothetical protein
MVQYFKDKVKHERYSLLPPPAPKYNSVDTFILKNYRYIYILQIYVLFVDALHRGNDCGLVSNLIVKG